MDIEYELSKEIMQGVDVFIKDKFSCQLSRFSYETWDDCEDDNECTFWGKNYQSEKDKNHTFGYAINKSNLTFVQEWQKCYGKTYSTDKDPQENAQFYEKSRCVEKKCVSLVYKDAPITKDTKKCSSYGSMIMDSDKSAEYLSCGYCEQGLHKGMCITCFNQKECNSPKLCNSGCTGLSHFAD